MRHGTVHAFPQLHTITSNSFLCICFVHVMVQVTGKMQGGMVSPASPLCQKSNRYSDVHKDTYSLRKSNSKGWFSAVKEISNTTSDSEINPNKWESAHLQPKFSSLSSSLSIYVCIYFSTCFKTIWGFSPKICGFLFSPQPQAFPSPHETFLFPKALFCISHWDSSLLSLHKACVCRLIFRETGYKDLNNPHKIKKNIFPHLCSRAAQLFIELVLHGATFAMWFDHSSKQKEILHLWQTESDRNSFGSGLEFGFFLIFIFYFILNKWHMDLSSTVWTKLFGIIPSKSNQAVSGEQGEDWGGTHGMKTWWKLG